MRFKYYFHRHSNHLIKHDDKFKNDFNEIVTTLNSISDADLIENFIERKVERPNIKSLSEPINSLLKENFKL